MKIKNPKYFEYCLLGLILLVAFLVRIFNAAKMAPFDFDQEYAANFAYSVLREYPIQLIGQGLSVQGLFMGPWYFYFLVPFYAFSHLHPIGGVLGSIVLGLITVMVYYWVGTYFFDKKTGLILALLRAVLFYKIQVDWAVTPSMSSEALVLLTWYLFDKYWRGKLKYLPLLAFCFGLYTSIHPILFPFYVVFVFVLFYKKKWPDFKNTLASLIAFLVPVSPLLLFEFFHNFLEVKALFSIQHSTKSEPLSLDRLLGYLRANLQEPNLVFGLSFKPAWFFGALIVLLLLVLAVKKVGFWKKSFHRAMLLVTCVVFIAYYSIFPTHVPEYYFLAISVLLFFYLIASFVMLAQKPWLKPFLLLLLGFVMWINLRLLYVNWHYPSPAALFNKDQIVKEILRRQPKNEDFYVSYIKKLGWNFGFNYLFKLYGHIPQTVEVRKPIYTIVIPKYLSIDSLDYISGNIGLIDEQQ